MKDNDLLAPVLIGCGLALALGVARAVLFFWLVYVLTSAAAPAYMWLAWTVLVVNLLSVLVEAVLRGAKLLKD
jgi:hypothetical protein